MNKREKEGGDRVYSQKHMWLQHSSGEKYKHPLVEEVTREDLLIRGRATRIKLLHHEQNQQHEATEQKPKTSPHPIEHDTTEVDTHDETCQHGDVEDCPEIVDLQ